MDTWARPCVVAIDDLEGERYKLIYAYDTDSWELYCLSDDQSETVDLVDNQPQIAAILSRKIDAWLKQEHATWKPKFSITKTSGKPVPPPVFDTNP